MTSTAETTVPTTSKGPVTALFRTHSDAEAAYAALLAQGYKDKDINVMMSDETRKKHFSHSIGHEDHKALKGAGVGGTVGGTVGAIVGAIVAIGTTVALPGLGLVIAGPIVAAFVGAGAGGAAGTVIGALVGSGLSEERARLYEQGLRDGGVVMSVRPPDAEGYRIVGNAMRQARGEHVYE